MRPVGHSISLVIHSRIYRKVIANHDELEIKETMLNKLYISMYHYTRDLRHSRYPEIKGLDLPLFEQQLQFFKENFNVVTMEDVIMAETTEGRYKLPDRALLLTFDDGYIDNYTVAYPLLKKYGFQGAFFIPAKTFTENVVLDVNMIHFILASADIDRLVEDVSRLLAENQNEYGIPSVSELWQKYAVANRFDNEKVVFCKRILQTAVPEELRNRMCDALFEKYVGLPEESFSRELYMNRDQIRIMKEGGMFFGLHGYDHYWLANLSEEQMHEDISRALEALEEFIDPDCWVMNYPYGNQNRYVIDYIRSRGCVLGLTTEVRIADLGKDDRYLLPRLDCNDFPPKSENYKNLYKE